MNVRYRVELSQAEREELTAMLSARNHAARKLKRAQILLASRDEEIAGPSEQAPPPSIGPNAVSWKAISIGP